MAVRIPDRERHQDCEPHDDEGPDDRVRGPRGLTGQSGEVRRLREEVHVERADALLGDRADDDHEDGDGEEGRSRGQELDEQVHCAPPPHPLTAEEVGCVRGAHAA